jgi:predicted DNA binding CopG/RHH family protein
MKKIPEFKNESEERAFWEENDSSDYLDWSKTDQAVFPSLKPTTKAISLRLPESMLAQIKVEANKRDVPYQSLMKIWLSEHLTSLNLS